MVHRRVRGKFALEYKRETVRQVKAGQWCTVVAKVLSIPAANLGNWVRLETRGSWAVWEAYDFIHRSFYKERGLLIQHEA